MRINQIDDENRRLEREHAAQQRALFAIGERPAETATLQVIVVDQDHGDLAGRHVEGRGDARRLLVGALARCLADTEWIEQMQREEYRHHGSRQE